MFLTKYETVTLVSPDAGPEGIERVVGRMREAIEKTGGREIRYEDWGRRKLAYQLQRTKNTKAHYIYLAYLGANTTVAELERLMKITEEAVLWQSVQLETRVDVDTFDFEAQGRLFTLQAKRGEAAHDEDTAEKAKGEPALAEDHAAEDPKDEGPKEED